MCISKGIHALAFIAFLLGLAILAHACGSCALAAGSIYDEGLYTIGLVKGDRLSPCMGMCHSGTALLLPGSC